MPGAPAVPLPLASRLRWLWLPLLALALTWLLLFCMSLAIRSRDTLAEAPPTIEDVRVVATRPDPNPPADAVKALQSAPPPPPAAPPALAPANLPELAMPPIALSPVDVGAIQVPVGGGVALGNSPGLGSSGVFGGFAGGGTGSGNGGGGGGAGGGSPTWQGKPLVPLSTARPQMPEWACKQKLSGWVEAVFTVDTRGHVSAVKIVDARPRGVFEAAALESLSHWLYEPPKAALEVRQRVPMDPADCVYNYR